MSSQQKIVVNIKKLPHAEDLELPAYTTDGAAGMDVLAAEEAIIQVGDRYAVSTGLLVAIPQGYEIQVRPRSGLAIKHGISVINSPGTIDSDYRGEIKVILMNQGYKTFVVERGDRIAQLVLAPVTHIVWNEVPSLDLTVRGEGGFGSTGV